MQWVALLDRDSDAVFRAMLRQELARPDFTRPYAYLKVRSLPFPASGMERTSSGELTGTMCVVVAVVV